MVDFHRPVSSSLVGILTCLILNRTIEELSLRLVDLRIGATMQYHKVTLPAVRQLEVFLGSRECLGHALLNGSSRLCHNFLHILVRLKWQALELLNFGNVARANVHDSWKIIRRIGVCNAEARCKLFWLLPKVLPEILMEVGVTLGLCHVEAIVPLRPTVSPIHLRMPFFHGFLAHRFGPLP